MRTKSYFFFAALCMKCTISPSRMTYALPSWRYLPAALMGAILVFPSHSSLKSSKDTTSALINLFPCHYGLHRLLLEHMLHQESSNNEPSLSPAVKKYCNWSTLYPTLTMRLSTLLSGPPLGSLRYSDTAAGSSLISKRPCSHSTQMGMTCPPPCPLPT